MIYKKQTTSGMAASSREFRHDWAVDGPSEEGVYTGILATFAN